MTPLPGRSALDDGPTLGEEYAALGLSWYPNAPGDRWRIDLTTETALYWPVVPWEADARRRPGYQMEDR